MGVVSSSPGGAEVGLEPSTRPLVTVVVPVYNGGATIADNVETIRRTIQDGLPGEDVEVVVVSDGSLDGTAERLLEARAEGGFRVIHYDRNLGKGYAVKTGALAGTGSWVAIVDADLAKESARLQSLQIRQQLGTQSLSIANQAPSILLNLFR